MMHSTSHMNWTGTHWRTSPYARAEYLTDATSIDVELWNNVYATQAPAAEALIYVDGTQLSSLRATSNGESSHTVALPTGRKIVSVVLPGNLGLPSPLPTATGLGMWIKSVKFNGPAQAVPARRHGTLFVGDSILNGSKLTSPASQAYVRQLQLLLGNEFPLSVLGRGGLALWDLTTSVGTQQGFGIKKLIREILLHEPMNVVWVLGYNDWFRRLHADSTAFQSAFGAAISELYAQAPHIAQVSTGLLTTNVSPYPDFVQWKNAAYNAPIAVSGLAQLRIDLRDTITTADISSDGIHPAVSGHNKVAQALRPHIVGTGEVPTARILASGFSGSVSSANRRIVITGRNIQYQTSGASQQWLETSSTDTQILAAKFYEVSVNGGAWSRLNGGPGSQTIADSSALLSQQNTLRFRRWGGDGSVVKTVNVTYT